MGTFGNACPTGTIRRRDRSQKPLVHGIIECPAQIMLYNKNMGGVDKIDSLIGFYCMFFIMLTSVLLLLGYCTREIWEA